MSIFEKFMLWLGFVRTKRALKGVRVIHEPTVRCAVGYEIFGRKYLDLLEHEIMHNYLYPTMARLEDLGAAIAFHKTYEAYRTRAAGEYVSNVLIPGINDAVGDGVTLNAPASAPLTEGEMKSAVKVRKNTMPNQPPPSPAGKPDRRNKMKTVKLITVGSQAPFGDLPPANVLMYTAAKDGDEFLELTFRHMGTNAATVLRIYVAGKNVWAQTFEAFTKIKEESSDGFRLKLSVKLKAGEEVRVSSDYPLLGGIEVETGHGETHD